MAPYLESHVLSLVIFLPLLTALALLSVGALTTGLSRSPRPTGGAIWRVLGLAASGLTLLLAIGGVLGRFDPEQIGPQFVEHFEMLPALGVHYFVGVDGLNLFLVLLTTLLVPLVFLASWKQVDRSLRSFTVLLLMLESALLGVFLFLDTALFFLAWQATAMPIFILIGIWGGSHRVRAATRFLLAAGLSSALMLFVLWVLFSLAHESGVATSFDLLTPPGGTAPGLLDASLVVGGSGFPWWADQRLLFAAFVLAFGLMMPIVPLHGWFPGALYEAPAAITALLAAVGVEMGAYGMLRFVLPLCPVASSEFVPLLMGLALLGIIYGSLIAAVQTDLKRLLAWWTIAQLGFVLLGTFSLEVHGLTGAVVAGLSHGLTAAALFFLVGAISERRGTSEIASFGGLARPMPVFAAFFGLAIFSAMGLPALSGFVGQLLIVLGGFGVYASAGLVASLGWVLVAGYLAWAYRKVALGPVENPENRGLIDLDWRERGILIALLVPIIWIGVYPNPVLRRVEPAVLELIRQMDERRWVAPVPTPAAGAQHEVPALEHVPSIEETA